MKFKILFLILSFFMGQDFVSASICMQTLQRTLVKNNLSSPPSIAKFKRTDSYFEDRIVIELVDNYASGGKEQTIH